MSLETVYFEHLRTRTLLGTLYRRFFIYPRIDRSLRGKVLDIGCGLGQFLSFRKNTIGADVNSLCIKYCRELSLEVELIDSIPWNFEDKCFDGIVLDNVLEHIENPNETLSEVSRLLKSKGVLVVGVPGKKGFLHDTDHKIFYDESSLRTLFISYDLHLQHYFYTPFKSNRLNETMRQYCLFGVFVKS